MEAPYATSLSPTDASSACSIYISTRTSHVIPFIVEPFKGSVGNSYNVSSLYTELVLSYLSRILLFFIFSLKYSSKILNNDGDNLSILLTVYILTAITVPAFFALITLLAESRAEVDLSLPVWNALRKLSTDLSPVSPKPNTIKGSPTSTSVPTFTILSISSVAFIFVISFIVSFDSSFLDIFIVTKPASSYVEYNPANATLDNGPIFIRTIPSESLEKNFSWYAKISPRLKLCPASKFAVSLLST